jgi:hypothetical protein
VALRPNKLGEMAVIDTETGDFANF